jgi:formiminotetrahydrofolate cyclodeaminase
MHQEDRKETFTFGKATFKNIPKKIKKIIEQSEEIQSTLKDD